MSGELQGPHWLEIAIVASSVGLWCQWGIRILRRLTIVPTEPERGVAPWGLIDVLFPVFGTLFLSGGMAAIFLGTSPDTLTESTRSPEQNVSLFLSGSLSELAMSAILVGWLIWRYGARGYFLPHKVDLMLALQWFLMLIVPVLLLQLFLTEGLGMRSNHPLTEIVTESHWAMGIAAFAAIVCAPVFEELLFRLLLQGWMEKVAILLRADPTETSINRGNRVAELVLLGGDVWPPNPIGEEADRTRDRPVLWIPIIFSSLVFALMHWGHGPDWMPLTFLAIGLGYIFQKTRRIVPCILVHMFVNMLGTWALWQTVSQGGPTLE